MANLNPQQQAAVTTVNGPILIIAGAGSGKTRVLTERIAYLIKNKYAQADNILAVTFTNKAAGELKLRVQDLVSGQHYFNWVGTFHAICLKILKANAKYIGYPGQFSIYDTNDQLSLIKQAMDELGLTSKQVNPKALLNYISQAKNQLITPSEYVAQASGFFEDTVAKIYPLYQKQLTTNSAMDFDDLLMKTVLLLQNNPEVLARYQNQFDFILIDEYQDTNHAQYMFAKLLATKNQNICVVGDDAQSIYSFRGATIENILTFESDYPQAQVFKLEQNYRSTKKILEASNHIIRLNKNQMPKQLWTENMEGENIEFYMAMDERDEANWLSQKLAYLLSEGVSADQIAVLYRTNAQSRNLEEYLLRAGINYKIVGNIRFYDRKEVKDIIAYLRLIVNPNDNLSLKRIINIPRRGIGPKAVNTIELAAASQTQSMLNFLFAQDQSSLNHFGKEVAKFVDLMKRLSELSNELSAEQMVEDVMVHSGYMQMLNDGSDEGESRLENIKELKSLAKQFATLPPAQSLKEFLDKISLIEDQYILETRDQQQVTLMTIHAAKGLEFSYVFIVGMEEGIFPHSRAFVDTREMEEERRLAYVAITRAKQKLYLTAAEVRTFFGSRNSNLLSRFVNDIPGNLIESATSVNISSWQEIDVETLPKNIPSLNIGDRVQHSIFGQGIVEDIDDTLVIVNFISKGRKELSLEYANLQKI